MKQADNDPIEKSIIDAIAYFYFFDYPPNSEEVYTFLKKKTSRGHLVSILKKVEKKSLIVRIFNSQFSIFNEFLNSNFKFKNLDLNKNFKLKISNSDSQYRYTLPQYSISQSASWRTKIPTSPAFGGIRGSGKPQNLNLKTRSARTSEVSSYAKASEDKKERAGFTRRSLGEGRKTAEVELDGSSVINNETIEQWSNRYLISLKKIQKILPYIELLSKAPQIKLIGLSGSTAMLNADESHDVDFFIIAAKNRLFTARFIALLLAEVMGIRRKRAVTTFGRPSKSGYTSRDKVCLNLFFDESDLSVPKGKHTEYVAHEILQMKPLIQKNGTYLRFIDANRWVFDIFPNASSNLKTQNSKPQLKTQSFKLYAIVLHFALCILSFIEDKMESFLKSLQLYLIKKHRTNEIVTDSQLWFHPEDFGEKIKRGLKS